MLQTVFGKRGPLKLLCLGAHSDDLEIGCGGAILRILEEYTQSEVHWVVFSAVGERATEASESAEIFLNKAAGKTILLKEFPDGLFPSVVSEIKTYFEGLKTIVSPDVIFTHYRQDLHQDHRLISDLTWNTFRNNMIMEYEIIKYDGDLGSPNCFFQLSQDIVEKKIKTLMTVFKSQQQRVWFTDETFKALMRIRGVECNANSKFAEAFYSRKILF